MAELWMLARGEGPVIINVPHAGTFIPPTIVSRLTGVARLNPDADWHVEKLYRSVAAGFDATLMCATHSRIVVDLNRDPAGGALYPGASNTEICPLTTFHDEPIYQRGMNPDSATIDARIDDYWRPYHAQLRREIERIKSHCGYCILLDGHSIVSVAPRFFPGKLPDLNLGTADGASCDEELAETAFNVLSGVRGFSAVHNGRFKGGYITRHYGQPAAAVHALQLEMAQSCYMDENDAEEYQVTRAAPLIAVLQSLVQSLTSWPPAPHGLKFGEAAGK